MLCAAGVPRPARSDALLNKYISQNIFRIALPLPAQRAVAKEARELLQGCGWGGGRLLRVAFASLQLLPLLQPVRARVLSAAPPFVRCSHCRTKRLPPPALVCHDEKSPLVLAATGLPPRAYSNR